MRILAGIVMVGLLVAPASSQVLGPVVVHDIVNGLKIIQQVEQGATMIQNQVIGLGNEARNLTRLQPLNWGNFAGEILGVEAQVAAIPAQVRGVVSSDQILKNSSVDLARTMRINAAAATANGAQQQAQVSNQYLGQISSTLQQKNANDAAKDQAAAVNGAVYADDLFTVMGARKQ